MGVGVTGTEACTGQAAEALPSDCVLLPLSRGRLLVSRAHAVFCRVPAGDVPAVEALLAGRGRAADLPGTLRAELARHGFFGLPREPRPAAPSVQLQLTNACNSACTYCCTNSGPPRQVECDFERLAAVVDDTREALGPGAGLALLGGEPLLVPWCVELAERALERGLRLTLFTNGTPLVDADLARRVAGLSARGAEIRVSLAGPTREICDALAGGPRFDAAVEGIHAVAAAGGSVIVDLMLTPQHVDDIAANLPELRRRLPPRTKVTLGVLYRSGRETGAHLFPSRARLEEALDRVAFDAGETIAAAPPRPLADRREGCACALGHHLHVRSDGALFTCFKMEEQVGDLARRRFADAVAEVRARPHPAGSLARCAPCPLATLCGGGCRSENLQFTGDPDEPLCGPWRLRVLSELLAEDRVGALEWPIDHQLAEARARGLDVPDDVEPVLVSRHLIDT